MPKLERDKIAKGIDKITLNDMSVEYDLKSILLDNRDGAEREFACYLIQSYLRRRLESFEDKPDRRVQERVLTESKWFALNQLTTELPSLIDRTNLYMLMEADQTGWYRQMEYQDLTDLMYSMIDDLDPQSSESYDWKFVVEKLVPAARAFGIKPELLGNATHQISKLRLSVPAARVVLERHTAGDITDAQAREDLKWIVGSVADPRISVTKLRPELEHYRGIRQDADVNVKGHIYLTGNESAVMMIQIDTRLQLRVIEQRLRKRVDFTTADYKEFAERALALLNLKEVELWQEADDIPLEDG